MFRVLGAGSFFGVSSFLVWFGSLSGPMSGKIYAADQDVAVPLLWLVTATPGHNRTASI